MGTAAVVTFLVLVFAFATTARGLNRIDVSAPMAFVAAGYVISLVSPALEEVAEESLTLLTELTLALILFHDAAQVRPRRIAADRGLITRLLLVGLPLTIAAGWLLGRFLFPGMPAMLLLLLAASVAPTDAGLGAATVLNPVVPVRVRRMLNVESGLNDGLCTPFVLFAIAALAGEEGLEPVDSIWAALGDLAIGVLVGGSPRLRRRGGSSGGLPRPGAQLTAHPGPRRPGAAAHRLLRGRAGRRQRLRLGVRRRLGLRGWGPLGRGGGESWASPRRSPTRWASPSGPPSGSSPCRCSRATSAGRRSLFAVLALTALRMVPVALSLLGPGMTPRHRAVRRVVRAAGAGLGRVQPAGRSRRSTSTPR